MPRRPQTLDPVTALITREADRELDRLVAVADQRSEMPQPAPPKKQRRGAR